MQRSSSPTSACTSLTSLQHFGLLFSHPMGGFNTSPAKRHLSHAIHVTFVIMHIVSNHMTSHASAKSILACGLHARIAVHSLPSPPLILCRGCQVWISRTRSPMISAALIRVCMMEDRPQGVSPAPSHHSPLASGHLHTATLGVYHVQACASAQH